MSHGVRRVGRWVLAVLVLLPLLLLGSVELVYRVGLARAGPLPEAPVPRGDFATRALWAAEEDGPLELAPRGPWTWVADVSRTAWNPRARGPSAGARMSGVLARQWVAARAGDGPGRGWDRGLQAFALSVWVSRNWSGEQLLAAYAREASFGPGLVGLDAAARAYFDTTPERLALPEAALLAGLPRSPRSLDPREHPERARQRRDWVLTRLVALGWISEAQGEEARRRPLP